MKTSSMTSPKEIKKKYDFVKCGIFGKFFFYSDQEKYRNYPFKSNLLRDRGSFLPLCHAQTNKKGRKFVHCLCLLLESLGETIPQLSN